MNLTAATLLMAAPQALAQEPAAPGATLGEVVFLGDPFGVEAAQLATAVQRRMPAVQQCYTRALAQSPTLAGEMQLDVTFGRNGRVTAVTATGLGSVPAVSACVAGVVRGMSFPRLRPREAQTVRFLVPVTFRRGA
ncbi:MAG: AgmX/PglI C-terminal domain-containing protein [Polyangiales bacterium]